MPWREYYTMDERLRFVARLLEGEKMARNRMISSCIPQTRAHPGCATLAEAQDILACEGSKSTTCSSAFSLMNRRRAAMTPFRHYLRAIFLE